MKITLYNSFHNREINIIPKKIDGPFIWVSENQKRRIRKKLCGNSDCCCKTFSSTSIPGADAPDALWVASKPSPLTEQKIRKIQWVSELQNLFNTTKGN